MAFLGGSWASWRHGGHVGLGPWPEVGVGPGGHWPSQLWLPNRKSSGKSSKQTKLLQTPSPISSPAPPTSSSKLHPHHPLPPRWHPWGQLHSPLLLHPYRGPDVTLSRPPFRAKPPRGSGLPGFRTPGRVWEREDGRWAEFSFSMGMFGYLGSLQTPPGGTDNKLASGFRWGASVGDPQLETASGHCASGVLEAGPGWSLHGPGTEISVPLPPPVSPSFAPISCNW